MSECRYIENWIKCGNLKFAIISFVSHLRFSSYRSIRLVAWSAARQRWTLSKQLCAEDLDHHQVLSRCLGLATIHCHRAVSSWDDICYIWQVLLTSFACHASYYSVDHVLLYQAMRHFFCLYPCSQLQVSLAQVRYYSFCCCLFQIVETTFDVLFTFHYCFNWHHGLHGDNYRKEEPSW